MTGVVADPSRLAPALLANVQLPGGGVVRGQLADATSIPADGSPVLLCVRKEHVTLSAGSGVPQLTTLPLPGQLAGQVQAASFLGLQEEYIVAVGGQELRSVQPVLRLAAGAPVHVTLAPEHCIVIAGTDA